MQGLAQQSLVALVQETAAEWELILPHDLLPKLIGPERVIARFQKHPQYPMTHKWCKEGQEWQRWDESDPPAIPDLDTSWIQGTSL